jgi:hypothetical protein
LAVPRRRLGSGLPFTKQERGQRRQLTGLTTAVLTPHLHRCALALSIADLAILAVGDESANFAW